MFGAEWAWLVLTGIGLYIIMVALELVSVAVTAIWDTGESKDSLVEPKRAA